MWRRFVIISYGLQSAISESMNLLSCLLWNQQTEIDDLHFHCRTHENKRLSATTTRLSKNVVVLAAGDFGSVEIFVR